MVQVLIVIVWLPIMVWTVIERLVSELRWAIWLAWMDCRLEHEVMRHWWRGDDFSKEDCE